MASWLIGTRCTDPVTPLGSVELLLSWPGMGFANQPVEGADRDAFGAAFDRWYARCDADPDNVALFYFCGHGCELGDQLLLLEDFGHSPLNPFGGQEPEKIPEFGKSTPMGRPGQPNEVAPAFLFLACEDSSYMTAQVLHPDGGERMSDFASITMDAGSTKAPKINGASARMEAVG